MINKGLIVNFIEDVLKYNVVGDNFSSAKLNQGFYSFVVTKDNFNYEVLECSVNKDNFIGYISKFEDQNAMLFGKVKQIALNDEWKKFVESQVNQNEK